MSYPRPNYQRSKQDQQSIPQKPTARPVYNRTPSITPSNTVIPSSSTSRPTARVTTSSLSSSQQPPASVPRPTYLRKRTLTELSNSHSLSPDVNAKQVRQQKGDGETQSSSARSFNLRESGQRSQSGAAVVQSTQKKGKQPESNQPSTRKRGQVDWTQEEVEFEERGLESSLDDLDVPGTPEELPEELRQALEKPEEYLDSWSERIMDELAGRMESASSLSSEGKGAKTSWKVPEGVEAVNRKQLLPPNLENPNSHDILVSVDNDFSTYSLATEPNDIIRLSSAYAKTVDRQYLLLYLAPRNFQQNKTFSLENRWKAANTLLNSVQREVLNSNGLLVIRWLEWCERENVQLEDCFPAKAEFVSRWVAELGGSYSPSYVRKHFNAIEMWHRIHFIQFQVDPSLKAMILKGTTRIAPAPRDQRRGITISDMLWIIQELQKESEKDKRKIPRNLAIQAAMVLLFFGMGRSKDACLDRRTKYKALSKDQKRQIAAAKAIGQQPPVFEQILTFDPKYDMTASSFTFFKPSSTMPALVSAQLPFDKAKHKEGVKLQLAEQIAISPELDPVRNIKRHLLTNKVTSEDPAFSYLGDNGRRVWLTKSFFRKRINEALDEGKRPRISLHTFRIGGANFYTMAGVNPEIGRAIGRWAGKEVFQRYLRNKEKTARKFLANIEQTNGADDELEEESSDEEDEEDEEGE